MKFRFVGMLSLLSSTVLFNFPVLSMEENFKNTISLQKKLTRDVQNQFTPSEELNKLLAKVKKRQEENPHLGLDYLITDWADRLLINKNEQPQNYQWLTDQLNLNKNKEEKKTQTNNNNNNFSPSEELKKLLAKVKKRQEENPHLGLDYLITDWADRLLVNKNEQPQNYQWLEDQLNLNKNKEEKKTQTNNNNNNFSPATNNIPPNLDNSSKGGVQKMEENDRKKREYKISSLSDAGTVFPQQLKNYFNAHLRNKHLLFFNVLGGGDCGGYTMQLSREKIVEDLRSMKNDPYVLTIFKQVVHYEDFVTDENNSNYIMYVERGTFPEISPQKFEEFVIGRYVNKRENLDAPALLTLGKKYGSSVYIWSLSKEPKNLVLADAYYAADSKNEKHILLNDNHFANLLTSDATQEEIEAAQFIEGRINQAGNYLARGFDYKGTFDVLKVPHLKGPFFQKKK